MIMSIIPTIKTVAYGYVFHTVSIRQPTHHDFSQLKLTVIKRQSISLRCHHTHRQHSRCHKYRCQKTSDLFHDCLFLAHFHPPDFRLLITAFIDWQKPPKITYVAYPPTLLCQAIQGITPHSLAKLMILGVKFPSDVLLEEKK